MARRRRNEGIVWLLMELPWWVTLVLGFVLMGISAGAGNPLVVVVFKMFGYLCFAVGGIGAIKMLIRGSLFASAVDIESIRAMSWRQFETLVGEAYRRQGYSVEETGGGGADGGIDLILLGKGEKVIIQCKQWKAFKVSVKVVREMYGIMVAEKADRVIIVTSGVYTGEAYGFARGKPIGLVDGKALVRLIGDIKGDSRTFSSESSGAPAVHQVRTTGAPTCPRCGAPMVLRTAKQGQYAGNRFWGCSKYPACKGIVSA